MQKKVNVLVYIAMILFNFMISGYEDLSKYNLNNLKNKKNLIPVAIIGSGPAGLSAGIYMGRTRIPAVIFSGDMPGGQLMFTSDVENWPGVGIKRGPEIIDTLTEQAEYSGAKIIDSTISYANFDSWPFVLKTEEGEEFNALSVIIATGSSPRKLNIKGEQKYWGTGVSSCAVCDCMFYQDKNVAVVGGGDSAVEEAIQLASYAKKVTIFIRKEYLRAAPIMQERLKNYKNVKLQFNTQVKEVLGNNRQLAGLVVKNSKSKTLSTVKMDGLFLAIGHNPNTDVFKKLLSLDSEGYIIVKNLSKETSVRGIFAAGDVEDKIFKQAVVAGSSGCQAHFGVVDFLHSIGWTPELNNKLKSQYHNIILDNIRLKN